MGRLRQHKRQLSWLAAVAVVGNVLAMALVIRPAAAFTVLDDILGPIALCTADGAKTMPGGSGPLDHAPGDHCPVCATLAQLALAVSIAVAAFLFPMPAAGGAALLPRRPLPLRVRRGGIAPRAPPLLA
jgi:hypothetical protein